MTADTASHAASATRSPDRMGPPGPRSIMNFGRGTIVPDLFSDPKRLQDVAFRFIRDIYRLPTPADAELGILVKRVQEIHAGLNAEKEFFALVSWLGRCATINQIDHRKMPVEGAAENLRPPDFVAVCRYNEKLVPVLIEVKTKDDDKLVWSHEYLTSLRGFAELLHLPLLVAWKRQGMWVLADTAHFQKRVTAYHLSFDTALKENLMSVMFGDALVVLKESFQFVLDAEVSEPLPEEGLIPEGTYKMKIKGGGFFIDDQRANDLSDEQAWLFMSCPDDNHIVRTDTNLVRIIHQPQSETSFPLFHVLLTQLAWDKADGADIDWNEEISRPPLPSSGTRLREALHEGLELGTVRYVLEQVPNTTPKFLE
jgi:Holliday junction resolvase